MPIRTVPYARQHVDAEDIAAVAAVLRSEWLTAGPAIMAFEERVAALCRARYAVAVSSATSGLHLACRALGVGPEHRAWTSPNGFVASANCAVHCGATIDFVDIDPRSYNLSAAELEQKLAAAEKTKSLPKVLIVVHFGGQPCELEKMSTLARQYGVSIIEDASHALGATYLGEPIGGCRYSDATVFSFQATKSIATGEGGMVLTNREDLALNLRLLRMHGINHDPQRMLADTDAEPWRYEQVALGFNYLMTDMQAALGKSQLKKLGAFIERRSELAKRYDARLADLPLQLPYRDSTSSSAWHLYPIQISANDRKKLRRALFSALLQQGIRSQVHYIPIHTQPYYRDLGFRSGDFPAAERYYEGALSLPLFYDLGETDQDRVIEIVRSTLT